MLAKIYLINYVNSKPYLRFSFGNPKMQFMIRREIDVLNGK